MDMYGYKNKNITTTSDEIVCPYCGYRHELNSDYFEYNDEFEEDDFECGACEQYFKVEGGVDYSFWATSTPLSKDKRR